MVFRLSFNIPDCFFQQGNIDAKSTIPLLPGKPSQVYKGIMNPFRGTPLNELNRFGHWKSCGMDSRIWT
jgi:hypothetical protein